MGRKVQSLEELESVERHIELAAEAGKVPAHVMVQVYTLTEALRDFLSIREEREIDDENDVDDFGFRRNPKY